MKKQAKRLRLSVETLYVTPRDARVATNSSACGACSCEQHCEQASA